MSILLQSSITTIVFILLLILIIIVALICCMPSFRDVYLSSSRKVAGGSSLPTHGLTDRVMETLSPYLDSLQKSKPSGAQNLAIYLGHYYGMPIKKIPAKSTKEDDETRLREIISDIIYEYKISDEYDFIDKSNITYASFSPDRQLLLASEIYKPSSRDADKIAEILRELILGYNSKVRDKVKIEKEVRRFLQFNKLCKLRDSAVGMSLAKLKKEIRTNPSKVFEIDYIALLPKLKRLAQTFEAPKDNREVIESIKRYLEVLNPVTLLNVYEVRTLADLEDQLRQAALRKSSLTSSTTSPSVGYLGDILANQEKRDRERARDRELEQERARYLKMQEDVRKKEQELKQREKQDYEKEKEYENEKEQDLEVEFYKKIQEDPELEGVAEALGMSLHDLYEEYKLERAGNVGAAESDMSDKDDNIIIDPEIITKLKIKLEKKLSELGE
jgi:hypothetical protein